MALHIFGNATRLVLRENLHHFLDGVPITSRCGHPKQFFDFTEVADRFHLPAIQTQDEFALNRNDPEEPLVRRGKIEGKIKSKRWSINQYAYESRYLRPRWLS